MVQQSESNDIMFWKELMTSTFLQILQPI